MNRPDLKVPEVVEQWTGADFVADTAVFQHSRRRVRRGGLPAVVPRHLGKRMVPDLARDHPRVRLTDPSRRLNL